MNSSQAIDPGLLLDSIYNTALEFAILTFDLDGKITSWNIGAERITGHRGHEVLGADNAIIFTPEDQARDVARQEMMIARATGRAEDYRWHMRKDGSRFWVDGVLTLIRERGGQHIGYLKMF